MNEIQRELDKRRRRKEVKAKEKAVLKIDALSKGTEISNAIEPPILDQASLYGLAGDIVKTIEPETEADVSALLVQLLAGFGNAIGKTAYFQIGRTRHYTKIFTILVGDTSQGRKGTSWNEIEHLLTKADESFHTCVVNGLSSGEGLVFHLRDPQTKKSPVRKSGKIVSYQDEIIDEGAREKRAFVIEPEFGKTLKAMSREGNTLSAVIREAWDQDRLNVLTKTPLKASNVHVSLVGHITKYELIRHLADTERANGFANRFLWVVVKRSKYLPFGGDLKDSQINQITPRLRKALEFGRNVRRMTRSPKADKLWANEYKRLSDGHAGLLGSVTSRAAPQVMRIACIYALMDHSDTIKTQHLRASLALWKYCENSAKYIFGMSFGSRLAEMIFKHLTDCGELSRSEINNKLGRNYEAAKIDEALKILLDLNKVEKRAQENTIGRPKELFRVSILQLDEFDELNEDLDEPTGSNFVGAFDNAVPDLDKIWDDLNLKYSGNELNEQISNGELWAELFAELSSDELNEETAKNSGKTRTNLVNFVPESESGNPTEDELWDFSDADPVTA